MHQCRTPRPFVAHMAAVLALTAFGWSLASAAEPAKSTLSEGPRVYEVDARGSTPYKTLASVSKIVRPGDTIRLKPGSGPYREILSIRVSGTESAPIVIEGEGNIITGFDPVKTWEEKDGMVSFRLKTFPCVIAYKGERLVQDAATGKFTKYADLNEKEKTVTLRPGVEKEGWEVSARALAVQVDNVSHQIFRNIRASGSTNDGFNLHGAGTHLIFENIEGFHNLDEGFSSHDSIVAEIRKGKFWGNDNGIANSFKTREGTVSTTVIDTDVYDNLGFGISLRDCTAVLKNVRIWHSGVRQVRWNNVTVDCENVTTYQLKHTTRQVVSYMDAKDSKVVTLAVGPESKVTGTPPKVIESADAP